jgi:hypothetical protein
MSVTSTGFVIDETRSSDRKENENPVTYIWLFFYNYKQPNNSFMFMYRLSDSNSCCVLVEDNTNNFAQQDWINKSTSE